MPRARAAGDNGRVTYASSLRLLALSASLLVACATGAGAGGDGSTAQMDAGPDEPDEDGGGTALCDEGQHRCGGGCIDDLENLPENGCRFGCGEPCPTPPDGMAACDEAGLCTIGCAPPFHLEGTECVCTPNTCDDIGYTCGAPDNGCGTPLDCGACDGDGVCMDGTCSCPEDDREPNDSTLAADGQPFLAQMNDADGTELTYREFNIAAPDDVDWYRFDVDDGSDGGAPVISVWLDDIPAGSDYDLSAFWTCDDGTPGEGCNSGATDREIGWGCSSNSSGTTSEFVEIDSWCGHTFGGDPGVLYVRVTAPRWGGSCAPYSLRVRTD